MQYFTGMHCCVEVQGSARLVICNVISDKKKVCMNACTHRWMTGIYACLPASMDSYITSLQFITLHTFYSFNHFLHINTSDIVVSQ